MSFKPGDDAPFYLPLMLDLSDKTLLFVGAGKAVAAKLRLLEGMRPQFTTLPHVVIVAPVVNSGVREFVAQWRSVCWQNGYPPTAVPELHERNYRPDDLAGIDLLWAYTDQPELNQSIAREAKKKRILASVANVRGQGGFIQPAVLRSESLADNIIVTVSTAGQDPRRSVAWRDKIRQFILGEVGQKPGDDEVGGPRPRRQLFDTNSDSAAPTKDQ